MFVIQGQETFRLECGLDEGDVNDGPDKVVSFFCMA